MSGEAYGTFTDRLGRSLVDLIPFAAGIMIGALILRYGRSEALSALWMGSLGYVVGWHRGFGRCMTIVSNRAGQITAALRRVVDA